MNSDKEKWIEGVFGSLQGSRRAKPAVDLFAKIESQIDAQEAKIIPMPQWKIAIAAAAVILVMNVLALQNYVQSIDSQNSELITEEASSQALISNYKLYE